MELQPASEQLRERPGTHVVQQHILDVAEVRAVRGIGCLQYLTVRSCQLLNRGADLGTQSHLVCSGLERQAKRRPRLNNSRRGADDIGARNGRKFAHAGTVATEGPPTTWRMHSSQFARLNPVSATWFGCAALAWFRM